MHLPFFSKPRVETFSDGVFAIILTLLVLEIRVPRIQDPLSVAELSAALAAMLPKLVSWLISFLMVCVIWVNHNRVFEQVKEINTALFWLNANLLLWTSFIPFPAALMGDYAQNPLAISAFGVILSFSAFAFSFFRLYLLRHPQLLKQPLEKKLLRRIMWRSVLFGPVLYWLGAAAAWVSPAVSFVVYLLIPVYFMLPRTPAAHNPTQA